MNNSKDTKAMIEAINQICKKDYRKTINSDLLAKQNDMGELARKIDILRKEVKNHTSELIKANKEVKTLLDMKNIFISKVAHDLRTPFTPIKMLFPILLDGIEFKTEDSRRNYFLLEQNLKDSAHTIDQILDVTNMESDSFKIEPSPYNIVLALQTALHENKSKFEQNLVNLTTNIDPDIPLTNIDKKQIDKVFYQIFDNTIRYNESKKKKISISIKKAGNNIEVIITDNGIGIEQKHLKKIFERFYKIDESRRKISSGIGLAISKAIIKLHGGKIKAESKGLKKGTTITFTIPIKVSK